jgi:hypothetical protein
MEVLAVGVRVTHTRRLRNGKVFRSSRTYDSYSDYLFVKIILFPFKAIVWILKLPFTILGFILKAIFRR